MPIQEQGYVGGPMRGCKRFNFDQFDSLAQWLRRNRKWNVHNPAEHDREQWPDIETWYGFEDGDTERCPKFDLSQALSWDLARVAESQHLVLLPGWEQSTGARHERHVAELTGSSIWLACQTAVIGDWELKLDMTRQDYLGTQPPGAWPTIGSLQPTPTPVGARPEMGYLPPARGPEAYVDTPRRTVPPNADPTDVRELTKRTFDTGATRDLSDHKPDYDGFLSVPAFRAYGQYMLAHRKMADGSLRASDNWQKGIPLDAYMKSLFRHTIDVWDLHRQGDTLLDYDGETPVTLKEALCGVIFNAFGYLHEVTKNG